MSNKTYPDVDALERLINANLDLGSPEKASQVASPEVPTVRKTIKVKLKTFSTNRSPQKSPVNSVGVSDETPIFNFSLVSAELEKTIETDSVQQKEAGVSVVTLSDISTDEPISAPVPAESAPVPTKSTPVPAKSTPVPAFQFELPNYSKWLVAIDFSVLIDWITFPFKDYFVKVADIELDEELQKKSTKTKPKGGT